MLKKIKKALRISKNSEEKITLALNQELEKSTKPSKKLTASQKQESKISSKPTELLNQEFQISSKPSQKIKSISNLIPLSTPTQTRSRQPISNNTRIQLENTRVLDIVPDEDNTTIDIILKGLDFYRNTIVDSISSLPNLFNSFIKTEQQEQEQHIKESILPKTKAVILKDKQSSPKQLKDNNSLLEKYIINILEKCVVKLSHYLEKQQKNTYILKSTSGIPSSTIKIVDLEKVFTKINIGISTLYYACQIPTVCSKNIKKEIEKFNTKYKKYKINKNNYNLNKQIIYNMYEIIKIAAYDDKIKYPTSNKTIFLNSINDIIQDELKLNSPIMEGGNIKRKKRKKIYIVK